MKTRGLLQGVMGLLLLALLGCAEDAAHTPTLAGPLPTRFLPPTATTTPTPTVATATPRPSATPTRSATPSATPTATPSPTATPIVLGEIVIVRRPVPAGYAIPPEALMLAPWPTHLVPPGSLTSTDAVVNTVARTALRCHEPLSLDRIAQREVGTGFLTLPDPACPSPDVAVPLSAAVPVVIAAQPVYSGTIISPANVALHNWPLRYLPANALRTLSDVIGRQAVLTLLRGQVIRADHLAEAD